MKKILQKMLGMGILLAGSCCAAQAADFTGTEAQKITGRTLQAALHFWTKPDVIDPQGGYHAWFGVDGEKLRSGDRNGMNKMLQVQMRILYSHAMAVLREKDPAQKSRILKQMDEGFSILERYRDPETGLFYAVLGETNEVQDAAVRTSNLACVIHMMSVIALELKDPRAAQLAKDTFAKWDRLFHDEKSGGYFEIAGGKAFRTSIAGYKSVSSQLHAMHALSKLAQIDPSEKVRMRFEELFRILTSDRILRPVCSAYPDMSADWNALPEPARKAEQMARYGLDMELVWYVLEAAQEMNMPLQSVIPWAEKIAGNVMRKGITPAGEVALYGYLDKPMAQVDHLYWWAQSEATAMLVKLYELTGKEEYWTCLGRVMRCSAAKMESPSGVWYSEVDQKTGLRNDQGGYGWKAGMHVIRAMIVAENSLAKIQK